MTDIFQNKEQRDLSKQKIEDEQEHFNILEILSQTNFQGDILEKIKNFYEKHERHKYSTISKYLDKFQYLEGKIDNIVLNINNIIDKLEKTEENKDIKRKLIKLQDHIALEIIRIKHIQEVYEKAEESRQKAEESILEASRINSSVKTMKEEIQESKKSYIVILGIFASIIVSFVGGFSYSNATFSNIHNASIYRLVFVMSFMALFIGNIIFALLRFLKEVALKTAEQKKDNIYLFNIFFALVMILDGLVWLCKQYH
ncbi:MULTISPECIES: hypothetical protein [Helicobacter]|uniref:hypothetical protein n=1 Tax=Helicobacter TaxID=209 RepID=UPI00260CFAE7|nr:hypothetical protein [Helicobacter sp. UBA3407]